MARSVRAPIEARSRRLRLEARKEPHWCVVERGLAGGYHRPASGAGAWWARVLVSSRPARYRTAALAPADDHEEADGARVLDWKQAQAAARRWAAKQTGSGPLTVERACERYVEHLRSRKGERAAREVEGRARRHILPVLGARRAADLTADELRRWHAGMVRGGDDEGRRRSRDSANRVLTILKAALNSAFRDGLVGDDRAWRRVGAFAGVGEARKVILGDPELQALILACPPGLRELVAAGAWTGARLGELTGARVRDLDADAATLRVAGKTGRREVHLVPEALAVCRELASGRPPDAHLFATAEGRLDAELPHPAIRRRRRRRRPRPGGHVLRFKAQLRQPGAQGGRPGEGRRGPLRDLAGDDRAALQQVPRRGPQALRGAGRAAPAARDRHSRAAGQARGGGVSDEPVLRRSGRRTR